MNSKIKEWIARYGTAEIIGLVFVIVFSNILYFITGNLIVTALITPWFENIGFYGTIVFRDIKNHKKKYGKVTFLGFFKLMISNTIEFGPAEYFDSMILRPFFFIVFPLFIPNYTIAIILASLTANITFYTPVIISYELKKKYLK